MNKNKCSSCGEASCSCKNKDFTKAVIEIDNPEKITLMRRVVIPTSMGDDTAVPPAIGKYHNVLLYYEANQKSYLYSSDGIPTLLVNGVTDYEQAVNLPQINGVTLLGDKSSAELKLADAPMIITVAAGNTSWSGADTAEDVYNFFLNKGKVNIVFDGGENYAYEISSAAYIPEEEKMMCTLAVATIAGGETSEFEGNALFGTMTLYTAGKAIDVSQIELQPKLYITDFTGLDLNYNELSGVPATNASIGMVKVGDGLEISSDGTLSVENADGYVYVFDDIAELRASTNLRPGSLVRTLGYYEPNDGGGSWFMVREKEDGDVDDAATTIIVGDIAAKILIDSEISYDQFGALGDGETDDYTYIKNTHTYANGKNLTVIANPEKTYYVKDITSQIPVMTNVDWKGAHFIIDDSGTPTQHYLFDVIPTEGTFNYTGEIASLYKGQSTCDLKGHGNLLVRLTNSNKKDFIRTGGNADQGSDRREYVRMDNDGRILDTLYFQFDQVTNILAKKLDEPFITIGNGTFKNIVNTVDSYNYYGRGIMVHRCNVTIEKINHTVEGEDDTETSSPYAGFICSSFCANLTIKDCNVSAHKQFYSQDNVAKGSYDINTEGTVGLLVENVHQTNDICNNNLWSIHGANYCRECTFKNSTLSKIDAHKGVYNLYVDNCVVGSRGIGCCGAGKIIVKNTVVNSYRFLYLRDDYGSWFDGDVEIYDCQLNCPEDRVKYLFWAANNDGTHDYGYVCKLPSLTVRNFFFNNQLNAPNTNIVYYFTPGENTNFLVDYDTNAANHCYPQVFDGFIDIKNVKTNTSGSPKSGFMVPIFNSEIERLYVSSTGSAVNRASTVTPYSKYNQNTPNFYIKVEDCDMMNPTYDFRRDPDDARQWHSSTHCSLWTTFLFAEYESFVNTHRPVMDITIRRCKNLFLGVSGRPVTLNLENCGIRQIQGEVPDTPVHMLYVNAKNCRFTIRQADIVDPSTQNDPGWIHNHVYTYHFEDCYFNIETWGVNQGNVMSSEAFLNTCRTADSVLTQVVTNINPTYNFSMSDLAATTALSDTAKFYGRQPQEVLGGVSGTSTLRKSGPTTSIPTGTNGVIDTDYGTYVIPTGAKFYDTTTSTDKTFNGTAWV